MPNRSKDFRRVFANAFGTRFGDNDVTLSFGFHENPNPVSDFDEEIAVVITPRTAKILANNLMRTVELWERQQGAIQVPPGKMFATLDDFVKASGAKVRNASKGE